MVAVPLGASFDMRAAARSPTILVKNMIVEQALTNQAPTSFAGGISDPYQIDHKAWIKRPGLQTQATGPGYFRGVIQQDGLFGLVGYAFMVCGTSFGSMTPPGFAFTSIGTVPGTDPVIFAASTSNLVVCGGGNAYLYNGMSFTQITMPSGQTVSWVCYLAGFFLIGVLNSQTIFFLADGTGAVVDALNYFSAETNAGNVIVGATLLDQLVLFKTNVTEFWQPSGNADLPFNRIVGQTYQRGALDRFAVCQIDNSIYFVGNDGGVYDCAAVPTRISTNAVEEQLRIFLATGGLILCWSFNADGHSYFVMTLETFGTLVYDALSQSWLSWTDASGNLRFPGQVGCAANTAAFWCGNPSQSNIYWLSAQNYDDDGVAIDCEIMGGLAIIGPPQRCDNFQVVVDSGGTTDPLNAMTINLAWSDDQGQTFHAPVPMNGGVAGAYSVQPVAKMLGLMRPPSRIFWLTCSSLGPFRISYARVNEYFAMPWPSAPSVLPVPTPSLVLNEDGNPQVNEGGYGNVLMETN